MTDLAAALWRRAPKWVRRWGILLSESRFTVTAAAVVIEEQHEQSPQILLLGHKFRPGGGWGVPGGFLQAGENPEAAIRRELREEIGLEITGVRLVSARTLSKYRQVELLFRCQPLGDGSPKGFEISRVAWFPLGSLPESLSEDQRSLIRRALEDRALEERKS